MPSNMKSEIDDELTDRERRLLAVYLAPSKSDLRRLTRLSIQYAIGTGVFMALAILEHQPLYALVVYVVLVVSLMLRVIGGSTISRVVPGIINKYESNIAALKENFAEVEPLLKVGYESLKANEATMPRLAKVQLIVTLQRIVDYYAATGQPAKADEWRAKLELVLPKGPPTTP
jgi:hypothetical protein